MPELVKQLVSAGKKINHKGRQDFHKVQEVKKSTYVSLGISCTSFANFVVKMYFSK